MFRAYDLIENKWVSAYEADPSHKFIDPFSGEEVYLRSGHERVVFGKRVFVRSHFYHPNSDKTERVYTRDMQGKFRDIVEHELVVEHLYTLLRHRFSKVALGWDKEYVWPFSNEPPRRVHIPDISVVDKQGEYSNIIAIEVQRSNITKKEFKDRMDFYSRWGVFTLWIFANYRKMNNIYNIVKKHWKGVKFVYYLPREGNDFKEDKLMLLAYKFKDKTYYKADLPLKPSLHFGVRWDKDMKWGLAFIPYCGLKYEPKRNEEGKFIGYFPKRAPFDSLGSPRGGATHKPHMARHPNGRPHGQVMIDERGI